MLKLISIVRKKLEKGLSAIEIAELLEEEEEAVDKIYVVIQEHTGYTDEEVYELALLCMRIIEGILRSLISVLSSPSAFVDEVSCEMKIFQRPL